jgi:hypothetical protein
MATIGSKRCSSDSDAPREPATHRPADLGPDRRAAQWRARALRRLEILPELPATSSRKVQKGALRDDIARKLDAERGQGST